MAYYLVQAAYTGEAWGAQIKNPQNRIEALTPMVEKLGGNIEHAWFAFGEYDIVAIFQMPDNVNMATFSITAAAGGAVKSLKTTPLMTIGEGLEAMKNAQDISYRQPGS